MAICPTINIIRHGVSHVLLKSFTYMEKITEDASQYPHQTYPPQVRRFTQGPSIKDVTTFFLSLEKPCHKNFYAYFVTQFCVCNQYYGLNTSPLIMSPQPQTHGISQILALTLVTIAPYSLNLNRTLVLHHAQRSCSERKNCTQSK